MAGDVTADRGSPGVTATLDHRTLWQRVHDHLRDEILASRLPPGTELQEVALSHELGVSRGPIREALGRLAAEGLVTVRPRRGAVVRAFSATEFLEAYQVREALEMMAVRVAVPRLSTKDIAGMQHLIDGMTTCAEAGDVEGFFEANTAFHQAFFEAAGNRMLDDMYQKLRGQIDRHRRLSLELRGDLRRSITEHKAILRAAKAGDVDRAVHLVSEHIRVPQIRLQVEEHRVASGDGGAP